MAIAVGTVTNGAKAFSNNRTIAHVTDVADYRVLLGWIWCTGGNGVTACTYNGVNILGNKLIDIFQVGAGGVRAELYYMIAPPEGNLHCVYTLSGNCLHACSVQAWAGVNPDDAFGVPITNIGTTHLITVTVGSAANEGVVDGGCFDGGGPLAINLGAGQTELVRIGSGAGSNLGYGSSYEVGAAANVMTWGLAGVVPWATGAVALRPFIPFAARLYEYEFNVWDPRQRIMSRDGHEVAPNEVRADKWGKLLGFRSPSSKLFADLADSPDAFYISGVTSDGETVRITPDEKLFADMVLKRLTR